jgi:hypothetical protein
MLYLYQLKIKDNKHPIAHELVFPENVKRDYVNCFRFVFMSIVYHADINLAQTSRDVGINPSKVLRHLTLVADRARSGIKQEVIDAVFGKLNLDVKAVQVLAKHFELSECNAISFSEDYAIFFNAVEVDLSPSVNDYLKTVEGY